MGLAQLAVFVRPPEAGTVKTRLAAELGEDGAAALYRAFVEDTIAICSRVREAGRVDLALWTSGHSALVSEWAERLGTSAELQPEGDLGQRLSKAFEEGLRRYERVVVIGSDMPTLPIDLIGAAFEALEKNRLLLGPAHDGGYYAIGASKRRQPSFDGVRWSTSTAFADTIAANRATPAAVLPPWYDIDEPQDLKILRAHLSVSAAAAPATSSVLSELGRAQR